jgi:hypothetical protein
MKEGFFMSDEKDVTSAGVPWNEVPEFARHHVEWMDGRHGSSQRPLPSLDEVPIPDILNTLPHLHEQRPRGSKAMIDAAGARARLHKVGARWPVPPLPDAAFRSGWRSPLV